MSFIDRYTTHRLEFPSDFWLNILAHVFANVLVSHVNDLFFPLLPSLLVFGQYSAEILEFFGENDRRHCRLKWRRERDVWFPDGVVVLERFDLSTDIMSATWKR